MSWQFANLNHVTRTLEVQGRALESMIPLWELFGKEYYAEETSLFDRAPWVGLSPAYAKRKAEEFGDKPLLRVTDDLMKSFTQQGTAGNIHEITPLSATFGSNDFKAIFHQVGTSRMPARPPLGEPDLKRYETIAGQYVAELVAKEAA